MPAEATVSLKEHFEKLLVEKEKGIRDALAEREKALSLQATEYERRLDSLNNEYGRIAKAQSTYVSYSVLVTIISMAIAVATLYYRH